MTNDPVLEVLAAAKILAQRYRILTGKPLGITGEVAEYEAARILGIELTPARQAGYDATEVRDGHTFRLQIKGRCLLEDSKPGQRMGSIDIKKDFDAVLLVLLDGNFEATVIYEAPRQAVIAELAKPGSKSRNERGALGISKFKSIAVVRWQRTASVPQYQHIGPPRQAYVGPHPSFPLGDELMPRKATIHKLLNDAALELLGYIKDSESKFKEQDHWVPAAEIKDALDLNFVAVPKNGIQYGKKGWVFATLARMLEDQLLVEHRKIDSRAFYRSVQNRK